MAVAQATQPHCMSTERGNDQLITVHTPFLAILPNQNAALVRLLYDVQWIHNVRLCVFVCLEKKRRQNIVGNLQKNVQDRIRHI